MDCKRSLAARCRRHMLSTWALAAIELLMDSPASDRTVAEGVSLYRQRKYAEARTLLRKLVAHEPTNADAWKVLGYLERDIGDAAAAATAFQQALNLQPDDVIALKGRARMALERAEA